MNLFTQFISQLFLQRISESHSLISTRRSLSLHAYVGNPRSILDVRSHFNMLDRNLLVNTLSDHDFAFQWVSKSVCCPVVKWLYWWTLLRAKPIFGFTISLSFSQVNAAMSSRDIICPLRLISSDFLNFLIQWICYCLISGWGGANLFDETQGTITTWWGFSWVSWGHHRIQPICGANRCS